MTTNQLRFQEIQESKRHNQETERELARSNMAREQETNRSNLASEILQSKGIDVQRMDAQTRRELLPSQQFGNYTRGARDVSGALKDLFGANRDGSDTLAQLAQLLPLLGL